jgi:hypothetical protein
MIDLKRLLSAERDRVAAGAHRICFAHVPKCAGTSVTWTIRRQAFGLREQALLKDFTYDLGAGLKAAEFAGRSIWTFAPELLAYHLASKRFKFAAGHMHCPPKLVDMFADRWSFITVLRNPVDRFLSAYAYDTFKKSDHFKNTLDIEEYLTDENGLWNGVMFLFYFSDLMYEDNPFDCDHGKYAEQAIENLKRFRLVGSIEKFDAWTAGFREQFGATLKVERRNASPRSEAAERIRADEGLMRRIRRICEPDIEVYRRVLG